MVVVKFTSAPALTRTRSRTCRPPPLDPATMPGFGSSSGGGAAEFCRRIAGGVGADGVAGAVGPRDTSTMTREGRRWMSGAIAAFCFSKKMSVTVLLSFMLDVLCVSVASTMPNWPYENLEICDSRSSATVSSFR